MNKTAPRPQNAGYTMIELAIVGAIFSLVLFVLAGMFTTGDATASYLATTAVHQGRGRSMIESMGREIQGSRLIDLALPPDLPSLEFQTPVDWDLDGDRLDDNNLIEWGCDEEVGPVLGSSITYAFEPYGQLAELVDGVDYNGDGDRADLFRIGRIIRTTTGGRRISFGDLDVLLNRLEPDGDIDGDGEDDPLFVLDNGSLMIRAFALNQNVDGQPRIETFTSQVNLRNPQF